jgi:hypothetical protein
MPIISKQLRCGNNHFVEDLANRCVRQNKAQEFIDNLAFERKHPFLRDWQDWKRIVSEYYSFDTTIFLQAITKHAQTIVPFWLTTASYKKPLADASVFVYSSRYWRVYHQTQFKTIFSEIKYCGRDFPPGNFDHDNAFPCACVEDYNHQRGEIHFPFDDCPFRREHILNLYVSVILEMLRRKMKRSKRRYYRRLLRVLYVLPVERLECMDTALIFDPPNIPGLGRNLLQQLYARGFLDYYTPRDLRDMTYKFEEWKHIREQSGARQSRSATMFDNLALLASKIPSEQMKFDHTFNLGDESMKQFENCMIQTQERFVESLHTTIVSSAKEIMMMFLFVSTIAMLGSTVIKYGLKVVIKALNLIYKLTCGKLFSHHTTEEKIIEQSGGLSLPLLPAMVLNNVIAPPTQVLTGLWNNPQTDRVMRRIGYLGDPKISRGIDNITDWVKRMITDVMNWYKLTVLGIMPEEDIDSVCSPVVTWYNECDKFFASYYEGKLQWNDANWSVLMNLYGRGMSFTRQPAFSDYKQDVWKIVFKIGNLLEKFNARGRAGTSIRNPPVTIYLAGNTGVGKSSVTYPLSAEILKGIFAREESPIDLKKYWKNLIYMRSAEQEFWDGYENQLVTVFDDFGQLVDSSASPNLELFEVIRASNSFPYPLHMAALDQKANTTFNSKVILVSSNLEEPKVASLNFPAALHRRFDICLKVSRKKGVQVVPGVFNPNIYEFQRYDMVEGKNLEYMSYKDIVLWCVTEYFKRKGFVDSMDNYITKALSDGVTEQGLGTFIGNCVCAGKQVVKESIESAKGFKNDLVSAATGDIHHKVMAEIRVALEDFRVKLQIVNAKWERFKEEHPYLAKAIKFIGAFCLVVAVIKLYTTWTTEDEKNKLMSPEQFVRGTPEAYNPVVVKPAKVEAYNPSVVKPVKVEGDMNLIYKNCCPHSVVHNEEWLRVSKNPECLECQNEADSPVRLIGPESYTQTVVKGVKVEMGCEFVCEHEFSVKWKVNPFKYYFIKTNPKCQFCNPQPKEEGVKDVNAAEMMMKVIRSNLYKIYSKDAGEPIGHAMFLRGRVVMCPQHYCSAFKNIQSIDKGSKVYFQNVFLDRAFEIPVGDILQSFYSLSSPDYNGKATFSRDIMAFPVKTATFHSNIEPMFAEKSQLNYVQSSDVVMPVLMNNNISKSNRACVLFRYTSGRSSLKTKDVTSIEDNSGNIVRYMRDLWEYSMDTQASECGAPLIVRNVNIAPGKIVGMHVAGLEGAGLGYSTPVYKEDVNHLLKQFNEWDTIEYRKELKLEDYPVEQCQVPDSAEFIRLGAISRPVAQPSKTKLRASMVFGKIQTPTKRPCALRPLMIDGKEFDPRSYRLNRLGCVPEHVPSEEVENSIEALVDDIREEIFNFDFGPNIKPVYTFEEAVVGIDGEPFINSIKRNTSPGYPFVHMPGFENRKKIFGDDEKCDMNLTTCKIIQRRVERIIELARNGVAIEHVFMDTLKDELKPIHKAHKTRLFSAGSLDYLIACKMYFNGIVAVLQKARNYSHISVGTNPNSLDWSIIVRKLLNKSENVIAGDFEGFDATQGLQLLQGAGKVLIKLSQEFCGTSDEDAKVMWVLLISLFNSVHVTGKEIYEMTHSLPSGHYLTAIINSIYVCLSFCTIWQMAFNNVSYVFARKFFGRCGIVAYGDDHILTVPDEYLDKFNQLTMPDLFSKIGLSYTMEDKDAVAEQKARKISEISYLKRTFEFDKDRNMWLGPLAMETILESPMWIHACPDARAQTIEQLDWALRELSLHSLDKWNRWYPIFKRLGNELGHSTQFTRWMETREIVLE